MKIPLSIPNLCGNELKYLKECIDTNFVSSVGQFVCDFEKSFAKYLGVKRAVAVVNGTAALHLSLMVAGVGPGDEVLVPNLTFVAPLNAVRYLGANPILIDANPDNFSMCPNALSEFLRMNTHIIDGKCINKTTKKQIKVALPVHVFGMAAELDNLLKICNDYNISLIEDASESLGSKYKGKYTGTFGLTGCFSFNGNKIITSGGGGMIVSDDEQVANRLKHLSTTAKTSALEFTHDEVGYNYRMVNLLAAVGLAQFENLDKFLKIKHQNANRYVQKLEGIKGVEFHANANFNQSNCWFYSLKVNEYFPLSKDDLIHFLIDKGIEVRPIWKLMEDLPMYSQCQKSLGNIARNLYETVINLPCSTNLSISEVDYICETLKRASV